MYASSAMKIITLPGSHLIVIIFSSLSRGILDALLWFHLLQKN